MGTTNDKKLDEAIRRMKKLKLMPSIINDFKRNRDLVQYSEPTPLGGILYWISNKPEWMEKVREFEKRNNALVYHAIHSYTGFGELLNLLFVSDDPEEWEMDNDDIEAGYVFSYVINFDEPMFSELGTIAVKPAAGGLVRVG